ncbi:regulator of chromosome condensation (RCC1) family protein isoform X2 [Wolffia australiana]
MMAAERSRSVSIEELPLHLITEIISSGCLSAADLASLEISGRIFREIHDVFPHKFRSMIEFAAFDRCAAHPLFSSLPSNSRSEILDRSDGNWKKVLRFLQALEQSSGAAATSAGKIAAGRHHTLLVRGASVYSCGSSLCGVLGHGQDTTQCVSFSRISFPTSLHAVHVSASHNHATFVMQSGEVFTCGDNSSFCCGHGEVGRAIFRPTLVQSMKGRHCVQAATGLSFTVLLTREGEVYTCGTNSHGQLGHGDNVDRPTPTRVEAFMGLGRGVAQIAAGSNYTLALARDGSLFSFGSSANFCVAHGDPRDQLSPRAVHSLRRTGVHVAGVSAADEHAVAVDSAGRVHTWGRGYCGALGHGDEADKVGPTAVAGLGSALAVQVCARKRKTFVVMDDGSVFGFGWLGFGSLGLAGGSDKVLRPRRLDCLRDVHVAQIGTGLYHTVAITTGGRVVGFGDNERAQLGLDRIRACPVPTDIPI